MGLRPDRRWAKALGACLSSLAIHLLVVALIVRMNVWKVPPVDETERNPVEVDVEISELPSLEGEAPTETPPVPAHASSSSGTNRSARSSAPPVSEHHPTIERAQRLKPGPRVTPAPAISSDPPVPSAQNHPDHLSTGDIDLRPHLQFDDPSDEPRSLIGPVVRTEAEAPPPAHAPKFVEPGFVARIDGNGDVEITDRPTGDLNDVLIRMSGHDPYSYAKRKFLDSTRAQRQRLASAARRTWSREALLRLPAQLAGIWGDARLTAQARRRLLFELWDECREPSNKIDDAADQDVINSGTARVTIIGFIRKTLPPGSTDAFTDIELRRMNEIRASRQTFTPYAGRASGTRGAPVAPP